MQLMYLVFLNYVPLFVIMVLLYVRLGSCSLDKTHSSSSYYFGMNNVLIRRNVYSNIVQKKKIGTCSSSGLNNVFLLTLFIVVNVGQYC